MLQWLARVLGLAVCLCLWVGLASEPKLCAFNNTQSSTSEENPKVAETVVSPIAPCPESADVVPDVDLTGVLAHPLLVTSEPALLQLHLEDVAHQQWQRFGRADVAPFVFCRLLPIQV